MMVGDDHIRAARVGVVNGFVRSDSSVTGDDQLRAVIKDRFERVNMNTVLSLPRIGM